MILQSLDIHTSALWATAILIFLGLFFAVTVALFTMALVSHRRYSKSALPSIPGLGDDDYEDLEEEAALPQDSLEDYAFMVVEDEEVDHSEGSYQADELLKAAQKTQAAAPPQESKGTKRKLFGKKKPEKAQ